MKKAVIFVLVCLVLLAASCGGQSLKIATQGRAIEVAKKLLGWDEGDYSAERITIENCFVPFVRKQVNGKAGWRVRLKNLRLEFKRGASAQENPFAREFDCVILAETGQLVSVESKIPKGVIIKPERIPVEKAEVRYGFEKIKGFPRQPSELSFKQILQRAFEERGQWVSTAKQIVAFYVIDARGEDEEIRPPQPLWLIHVRGFSPPFPLPSGGAPRRGQEGVDPGSIDYMRMLFTGDGEARGGGNMLAPK